jgi:hypothetical protein
LFGDADLQLTSAQRREHSFEISRNRLHRSDFYYYSQTNAICRRCRGERT